MVIDIDDLYMIIDVSLLLNEPRYENSCFFVCKKQKHREAGALSLILISTFVFRCLDGRVLIKPL